MNFKDHLRGLEKLRDSTRSSHGESHTRKKYAHGGPIKGEMKALASKGRYGDSRLAEIGPRTAKALDKAIHRGRKDINPRTGLREYMDPAPGGKRTAEDAELESGPELESGKAPPFESKEAPPPPPPPAPSSTVRDILRPVMSPDQLLHWADLTGPNQNFIEDSQFFAHERYNPHKEQDLSTRKKHNKHTTHFIDHDTATTMANHIRNDPSIQATLANGGNFVFPLADNVQKYTSEIDPNTGKIVNNWRRASNNFGAMAAGRPKNSILGTNRATRSRTPNGIHHRVTHYEG